MVNFKKLARKARVLKTETVITRSFGLGLAVKGPGSEQWSHADTDRLAKFFGHSKEMYELLEKLHRDEALKTSAADVEVATLLKKIDAACFND